ncbi:hypothetical protein GGS20DRAFT_581650 [Poronia punctata]|nr:hypothetical protein GGS20DRAFT_581650 [Poronia punctata]
MYLRRLCQAVIALLAVTPIVHAHTWVEYLYQIGPTGSFTGKPGYPIGYIPRGQGVPDDLHQNKILDKSDNPAVCKPLSSSDTTQYPPLKGAAGDYIALQYQENGHVTQPEQTLRPFRGGNVYVYGTMQHKDSDGINDVLNAWTADGKGGNKKGRLLATHYFDDGQCFQNNPGNPIAQERKAKYGVDELFCQTDIQLPADLPSEGTYTLMWVWDWPRIIDDSSNVTEIYSTCAQIDLTKPANANADLGNALPSIKLSGNDNILSAGISSQLNNLIEATALGIGTNSPPAPTGLVVDPTGYPDPGPDPTTASSSSVPVPVMTSTATSTTHSQSQSHGRIKTVTVTAPAETIVQYTTIVVGGPDSTTESASASATETETVTVTPTARPTTLVPVTSVSGFLRRARITGGRARRAYSPNADEH